MVGVELDPELARDAEGRLDRVITADAAAFAAGSPPPEAPFDCLIAADVLEHLADPWAALRGVAAMLAPGAPYIQFTYGLFSPVPRRSFGVVGRPEAVVLGNLPPARVWVYRKAAGS